MLLLTFRDLVYRRTRFIVVTILGAVVFALLFVMTGLVNQFNLEPAEAVEQFGADEWVLPEGVSAPFTSVSVMPAAAFDAVEAATKARLVITRSSVAQGDDPEEVVLVGFEAGALGAPQVVEGRAPTPPARWCSTVRSTSTSAPTSPLPANRSPWSGSPRT
jgi:putative ABC transport system permease protein